MSDSMNVDFVKFDADVRKRIVDNPYDVHAEERYAIRVGSTLDELRRDDSIGVEAGVARVLTERLKALRKHNDLPSDVFIDLRHHPRDDWMMLVEAHKIEPEWQEKWMGDLLDN